MTKGSPATGWPLAVRLFHWSSAMLIAGMLVAGTIMVRVDDSGLRFDFYQMHKAFGIVVLIVTLLRLSARAVLSPRGPALPGARWQGLVAHAAHLVLYLLILVVAFSGWIMASASPLPVPTSVFGLFDLPRIVAPDMANYQMAKTWHGWLTKALLGVILVHVLAALKHHIIDKDNVLRRMIRHQT